MPKSHSTRELRDWVAAAKDGDKEAFSELVFRFQDMAYSIAYAMLGDAGLAQDAAQEAFIAAYLNLSTLREPAAFPGWFRRVVIKHSDRERRSLKPTRPLDEPAESSSPLMADPTTSLEESEHRTEIHHAIAELPALQKQIVTLFYLRDYSQKEIEEFLELPVSTIKKHLFMARKKLRGRLEAMVETQIQSNRPSMNGAFASEVQYLLALRTGDFKGFKAMVERQPDLLDIRFKAPVTRERHYWPLGGTTLHWAVVTGDEALLEFLLSRNVNLAIADKYGMTPLHTAVWMRQESIVTRLLAGGANPDAGTDNGHTPLHFAAMRHYGRIAKLLIDSGARADIADKNGRTPMDWAVLKNADTVIEILASHSAEPVIAESLTRSTASDTSLMETGIKVIDLFAPLVRGGQNAILTPHSNVGSFVVLTELLLRMDALYGARTLCLGLDDEIFTSRDIQLLIRDAGIGDVVSVIFGNAADSAQERSALLDSASAKAKDLRAEGKEVLVLLMNQISLYEEFMKRLKPVTGNDAGITTLYFGAETAGAKPAALANPDAVIGFDFARAKRALYPAVDPLYSRSRLLQEQKAGREHQEIAAAARRLLRRYQDLQPIIESRGLDLLPKDEDRTIVERAKRLDRFLTQPFHWTEPWTNVPGVHVPLTDTLHGCRAILEGECDDMPEDAFYFIRNLKDAREKSHGGNTSTVTRDSSS